jgi:GT2 family glycosyltransferase
MTPRAADAPVAGGLVYVLLPVHNRRAVTERFVRCLAAQTDQGFHLVLVDDGSTDGTSQMVTSILPESTVIRGTGSWWWAGSLERARRWVLSRPAAPGDLVLIANDDTTFEPDFIAPARAAMAGAERVLLLAQLHSAQTGELKEIGTHVDWERLSFTSAHEPDEVNCYSTRGLFLRLADLPEIGAFHTILLPHYLSDYEFTLRARRRGFEFRSDPKVRLVLDETTTGIRAADRRSARTYLDSVLTTRSTNNPMHWSTFLILASPRRYLVRNLYRVWRRFLVGLARAAMGRPEPAA